MESHTARALFATQLLLENIHELPVPQYLLDNIDRILAVTSDNQPYNEAFSRTIIDQIIISTLYDENLTQDTQKQSSLHTSDPTILELQYEAQLQRQVTFRGEQRLLSGFADYTIWYDSENDTKFATNLIMIEAKKVGATESCLGQLTAYMGIVHACRKEEVKQNCNVYGASSDGLKFRFCSIDNNGNWSQSRLLEWAMGDQSKIYSLFRSFIKVAALSSPSTSPSKNPRQRESVLVSFGSPKRNRKFGYALSSLELMEVDDETEMVKT